MPEANILIGTPAYGGQVHVDYVHGLMDFFRHQIRFRVFTIGNESLITRARNTIISTFYQNPAYTHLLFLDGDVRLTGQGLRQLLRHHKAVIGAPVAPQEHGSFRAGPPMVRRPSARSCSRLSWSHVR